MAHSTIKQCLTASLVCVYLLGCQPSTTTERNKPRVWPIGNDELVITTTVTKETSYYWIAGVIPFPNGKSTTTNEVRYRVKKGLFKRDQDIPIQTSLVGARPPGAPPVSHQFIEFLESPPYYAIDLYVSADDLSHEQYLALAEAIKASTARTEEAFGRPVASIRHSAWRWDS